MVTNHNSISCHFIISAAENLGILTLNHPMNKTISQTLDQNALKFTQTLALFRITCLLLVLSMIPAGFTVYLVEDRICEAFHLQIVGGLKKLTYWVTSYLYDLVSPESGDVNHPLVPDCLHLCHPGHHAHLPLLPSHRLHRRRHHLLLVPTSFLHARNVGHPVRIRLPEDVRSSRPLFRPHRNRLLLHWNRLCVDCDHAGDTYGSG